MLILFLQYRKPIYKYSYSGVLCFGGVFLSDLSILIGTTRTPGLLAPGVCGVVGCELSLPSTF